MTKLQILKFQAKLIAPTASGSNEAVKKLNHILNQIMCLIDLKSFEEFCANLSRSHVGSGYTA